jgi:hypothetical protein
MSKKHTVLYMDKVTIQGVSVPAKAKGAIAINIGKLKTVQIGVASSEGWVSELIVKQVPPGQGGGAAVAFTVELCDSGVPYFLGSDANKEKPDNTAPSAPIEMFRVFDAAKAGTVGTALVVLAPDFGYQYINQDQETVTSNQRFLYLTIIPTASANLTKWNVSVTTMQDVN